MLVNFSGRSTTNVWWTRRNAEPAISLDPLLDRQQLRAFGSARWETTFTTARSGPASSTEISASPAAVL